MALKDRKAQDRNPLERLASAGRGTTPNTKVRGKKGCRHRGRHSRKLNLSFGWYRKGYEPLWAEDAWKLEIAVGKQRTWPWLPGRSGPLRLGIQGCVSRKQSSWT